MISHTGFYLLLPLGPPPFFFLFFFFYSAVPNTSPEQEQDNESMLKRKWKSVKKSWRAELEATMICLRGLAFHVH